MVLAKEDETDERMKCADSFFLFILFKPSQSLALCLQPTAKLPAPCYTFFQNLLVCFCVDGDKKQGEDGTKAWSEEPWRVISEASVPFVTSHRPRFPEQRATEHKL